MKEIFEMMESQVGPCRTKKKLAGLKSIFQLRILNDQNSSNKSGESRLVGHN